MINLLSNPSFETDTSGWSTSAPAAWVTAGATLTRVLTQFANGIAAARVQVTAQQNRGLASTFNVVAGQQYTASVWVKGTTDGANLFLGEADAGTSAVAAIPLNSATWTLVTVTWTAAADTAAVVGIRTTLAAGNCDLYVDGFAVESGPIAHNWTDVGPVHGAFLGTIDGAVAQYTRLTKDIPTTQAQYSSLV